MSNSANTTKSEIIYLNGVPTMAEAHESFPIGRRVECSDGTFMTALRHEEGPAAGDYARRGFDRMVSVYGVKS